MLSKTSLVITTALLGIALLTCGTIAWAEPAFKVLHNFSGGDGRDPWDALLLDFAGNLYGTTHSGGGSDAGTIFKLAPKPDGRWAMRTLYSFTGGADGYAPMAGLVKDAAGNLYGTTYAGGKNNGGTAFKLALNPDGSWTQSVLHHFGGSGDGNSLVGGLLFDPMGNLYGAATYGGDHGAGVVYRLTPEPDGSWKEKILHHFAGKDGRYPDHSSLVFGPDGALYGVTATGGRTGCMWGGCGTAFKLVQNPDESWTQTVLHRFSRREGSTPESTPWFDRSGNLYGTTEFDGKQGMGTVFELTPGADGKWTVQALHRFHGSYDGASPDAGVIGDAAGNLYGTAALGGAACGCGTVFKLSPNRNGGWTKTILHRFHGKDGNSPYGALIMDSAGNLYGTTQFGGKYGRGVVFEITP